ncbi:urea amidolyase associated protein UAAP1 [Caldimonas brevitalea]|uniref:urea amidolyase associated protein UAAP1 n=1 Tax=Caldimonas brevitalea TaxID=413882 RepID=UPI00063FF15E|nr:urea amidolyase associated protein UAAP1 [Caldimonas brevitalea]
MKPIAADRLLLEELVPGGHHWSGLLRRGSVLRLTDLQGGANVSTLFYHHDEKLERYNMPDTLKAQHTAYLTAGHTCHSDMGRVLCSIVADSVGWHDTWCGAVDAEQVRAKYGDTSFQQQRNDMYRNGRDGLLVELGKWGLGKRDLVANVNFFSKAVCDETGGLRFVEGHSRAGDAVELRFEMNTLVVLSTAPHPLDPKPRYAPAGVRLSAWRGDPVTADDACRTRCPQNGRAFANTERFYAV